MVIIITVIIIISIIIIIIVVVVVVCIILIIIIIILRIILIIFIMLPIPRECGLLCPLDREPPSMLDWHGGGTGRRHLVSESRGRSGAEREWIVAITEEQVERGEMV